MNRRPPKTDQVAQRLCSGIDSTGMSLWTGQPTQCFLTSLFDSNKRRNALYCMLARKAGRRQRLFCRSFPAALTGRRWRTVPSARGRAQNLSPLARSHLAAV